MCQTQSFRSLKSLPLADGRFSWVAGRTPSPLSGLRFGTSATLLPRDSGTVRRQFLTFEGAAFADALDTGFLIRLQQLCDEGHFIPDAAEPGQREVESPQRCGRALNLVLSCSPFLRWLEEVTGCGVLREVAGRVVQTFPRSGDELHWHDDRPGCDPTDDRRLALVLNMGAHSFEGGQFEMRRKASENTGQILLQYQHRMAGSLLIFRVSGQLEHRVLPLVSGGPRRVYTGWAMGAGSP